MFRLFATLFVISLLVSCVKFQINPGNVVGDTDDAGKEAYETIKEIATAKKKDYIRTQ